jgi:hypothetical protein
MFTDYNQQNLAKALFLLAFYPLALTNDNELNNPLPSLLRGGQK